MGVLFKPTSCELLILPTVLPNHVSCSMILLPLPLPSGDNPTVPLRLTGYLLYCAQKLRSLSGILSPQAKVGVA